MWKTHFKKTFSGILSFKRGDDTSYYVDNFYKFIFEPIQVSQVKRSKGFDDGKFCIKT